jgi:hypothetical protein
VFVDARAQVLERLGDGDLVLDVGGWAQPFSRADWVLDLMPYETRGLYGPPDELPERFSASTWVQRDICDREPWPFADKQFDFAICSHTLEDVRDPVWVCSELVRVAKAGYVEVPSRLDEQTPGIQGPWVGWGHHHWLCDVDEDAPGIEFIFKHHILHGRPEMQVAPAARAAAPARDRVAWFFWQGSFRYAERIFVDPPELDAYLAEYAARHPAPAAPPMTRSRWRARR